MLEMCGIWNLLMKGMNKMQYPITNKKLGMTYHQDKTIFRLWSPIKENVYLCLYENADTIERKLHAMHKAKDGTHELTVEGDLEGYFYTFLLDERSEVTDPYSVASSLNSIRSAVVDLSKSNPEGWEEHKAPKPENHTDAIIYELHIKDFTFDKSSNVQFKGKFLGLSEKETSYNGFKTALSHLVELGITHVHLMPVYDFLTVKEDSEFFQENGNYNWGYDPELYNNVEGSYATQPENPYSRIRELKKMIMALHNAGIQVVVDVVYNHTYLGGESNFNAIMPGYYHRFTNEGYYSNGSGCGNEIASENPMVRKFIVDSVKYWLDEYKLDGFRFDLMALTDKTTMKLVVDELRKDRPDILIYGEPWQAGGSTLSYDQMPVKGTQNQLGVAMFNDEFRDAIKGDNNGTERGFVQGHSGFTNAVETGIVGSIEYESQRIGFTQSPIETINYINAHDDLIIYDKMKRVFPSMDEESIIALNRLSFGILLTSQGIPFFHSGNEFLRSKDMISNTYNAPSSINNVDWSLKEKNYDFFKYMKDLIQLRKDYKVFRLSSRKEILEQLRFVNNGMDLVITYTLKKDNGDFLFVIHNARHEKISIEKLLVQFHLEKEHGISMEAVTFKKIFNKEGLIAEEISDDLLIMDAISTEVFYIKS